MIVHFIASEFDVLKDIDILRLVLHILQENKYELSRDWVESAYGRRLRGEPFRASEWSSIYNESLIAIAKADVIIAEASHESFSMGFQIAYAIQQKKPILLLQRKNADKDVFISGLKGAYISHKEYEHEEDLEETVRHFLIENHLENKDLRFNFFIDRPIYSYLRWASERTGKTKAEILRELVRQEIDKKGLLD